MYFDGVHDILSEMYKNMNNSLNEGGWVMIELSGVTKYYDGFKALDNVSFQIWPGEIVGLVGANGAGKTSCIKLLTRYITPDVGSVLIDGRDIFADIRWTPPMSYIPDEPVYYEFLTVEEHLQFIRDMYPMSVYRMEELIEQLNLTPHLKKMPSMLSKGNTQKLMIAMALLRNFDYLIADEPFTGLDSRQMKALKNFLMELRGQGKGVLLSTHLLDVIELFCDRYIMIDEGEVFTYGTKEWIAEAYGLNPDSSVEEIYIALTDYDVEEGANENDSDSDDKE